MKIIGVVGSPRMGSNTKILVEEALKGASEIGAETKLFNLSQMDVSPCKACMHCKNSDGECATADDMQIIYNEIKEADGFILGSPVYMWQMTAQSKLFTDRLYAFFGSNFEDKYGKKNLSLIFSQGGLDKDAHSVYFEYTKNMYQFLGFNVVDLKTYGGNNVPEHVKDQKDVLKEARDIGKKLAETG